jgi:hypothetical protein
MYLEHKRSEESSTGLSIEFDIFNNHIHEVADMKYTRTLFTIVVATLIVIAGNLFHGLSSRLHPALGNWSSSALAQEDLKQYDSAYLDDADPSSDEHGLDESTPGITGGRSHGQGMRQHSNEPQDAGMRQRGKNFIKTHKQD